MARQASITLDHVKTAVAALQGEGKNVSSRSVREKLGNVGSMGTVNRLLQQALSERDEKPQSLRQLPSEIQLAFLAFADQQAKEARSQIAEELIQCRREMAELAEDNNLISATVESLHGQLSDAVSQRATLEGRLEQLANELASAREETSKERGKSETARMELVKLQHRIDVLAPLEGELRNSRAQCVAHRDACVKLEQTVAVLETKKDSMEQRSSTFEVELSDALAVRNKLTDKVETISSLLDKEREARMQAERELAVMTATYARRRTIGNRTGSGKGQKS